MFYSRISINKNECSVAATGPPICEGLRENPKFQSSSKAGKFELLLLHIVLLGDVGYRMCEWCLGGSEGMSETGRPLLSSKAVKFEFFDAQCARMCEDFFGGDVGQRRKDYGLEVLSKTPGLYQVPKLKILIFCLCTVYFFVGGGGGQSWEDYGF